MLVCILDNWRHQCGGLLSSSHATPCQKLHKHRPRILCHLSERFIEKRGQPHYHHCLRGEEIT
ncbi:unnamed protein product [Spirodela intermedia]|uniref:Uncharacterized protein n=1 Tax=Spirodela intermedia TaxID=51605 RepID=A0A7I8JDY1_SPIIN|nr:unnamed protein product [Spirodela intermedia]CAA6668309.1 unnamed protein product [Spirodela intermedia]